MKDPESVLRPPDVLAVRVTPAPPDGCRPLRESDLVTLTLDGVWQGDPVVRSFRVDRAGVIQLGMPYGSVVVGGLRPREARQVVAEHLGRYLNDPQVTMTVVPLPAAINYRGNCVIQPDGCVALGEFGHVFVAGLTLTEGQRALEQHFRKRGQDASVTLEAYTYPSRLAP
jgi:protein involved in polysaccharide export with SLBB domain